MRLHFFAILFLIATCCTACATSDGVTSSSGTPQMADESDNAAEQQDVEISTHKYSTRLRDGDGLWVTNPYGDLRIRMSGDSGVHYAAVIQKLDGEQRDVEFHTNRQPGGLAFSVDPPAAWIGRVDTSARVPDHSALELKTTDGFLEVRTAANPVNLQTVSGEIRYRGTGTIQAISQQGDIEVAMHGLHYAGEAGVIMTGGNVAIWVMPGTDLTVLCDADGETINEVPDNLGKAFMSDGTMHLKLGAGTSGLVVQAGGDIVIRALPQP